MTRNFEIPEPTRNLRMLLLLCTVVPSLTILSVIYALLTPKLPPFLPAIVLLIIIVPNIVIGRIAERRQVTLDGNLLDVQAGMGHQRVAVAEIDLDHARTLRLDEHPEWRPFVRTGGLGMPGLSLGWFRTRNLTRIFCALTHRDRVLLLPYRDKQEALLLSLTRPDELLGALRAANDVGSRRG